MSTVEGAYCAALAREGLDFEIQGPWAVVAKSFPVQAGWKLHVSAIPAEAERLIGALAPFLGTHSISFKVARDEVILEQLNAGRLGATQVGKFITIYPEPKRLIEVAGMVRNLTTEFQGPRILTDVHLGGVVYARYGAFTQSVRRDRLGLFHRQATLPGGSVIDDEYRIPHAAPPGVENPFVGFVDESFSIKSPHEWDLFGPGYRVVGVLRDGAKGSAFLAINLQSQEQVALEVLKQGRQHCMSDRFGRDIRWRLQRELATHQHLKGISGVAQAGPYFEVGGDGYLAIEHIDGDNIETVVDRILKRRPWALAPAQDRARILNYLLGLLEIVSEIHQRGFVHRDISATNVLIDLAGKTHLIDFEMAHAIDDDGPLVGLGTPGFASWEQESGAPPSFSDDVYSLGCLAALAVTGIDPRRLLYPLHKDRLTQLATLTGESRELDDVLPAVANAVHPDPSRRTSLVELRQAIAGASGALRSFPAGFSSGFRPRFAMSPEALLERGLRGLECNLPRSPDGIWLSLPAGREEEDVSRADLTARRSAGGGAAGVLYLLARLKRASRCNAALETAARRAVQWLTCDTASNDRGLPGLHAGEDGVAVAVLEACAAGLAEETELPPRWIEAQLSGGLDWPDLVHGAAGQGIAALICRPELSHRCAKYLISTQDADGGWSFPLGFPGLSGRRLTGFAHGAAGVLYFLVEYSAAFEDAAANHAWRQAARWLLDHACPTDDGGVTWPYADDDDVKWQWWCHGGPGIALSLLRLAELTGDTTYLDSALKALVVQPAHPRHGNLSQCHGLSGLGEIYLEAYRLTSDEQWLGRATDIAGTIGALARHTPDGASNWLSGNASLMTGDLYLGTSGILHFLLRLVEGAPFAGFPLLTGATGKRPAQKGPVCSSMF